MATVAFSEIGVPGHFGASRDRLLSDWTAEDQDVNEIWNADWPILGGRAADLSRNNPYAVAMLNAMAAGVIGPDGISFRSLYQVDQSEVTSPDELALRRKIQAAVENAFSGKSLDASGLMGAKSIQETCLASKAVYGEAFVQRVLLPHRPGQHTHATCWRVIHPFRVSNPKGRSNDSRLFNGVELDAGGTPVAVHISTVHPSSLDSAMTHVRVPFFDRRGVRQMLWYASRRSPEQIRGIGWFAPVMLLLQYLGKTEEAHVVAKRMQAAMGLIVEVDDPKKAAAADRNGEVLSPNTKFVPGKTYYVKKGTKVTPVDFKYNGLDLEAFSNHLLQALTAAFGPGVPYQYVIMQLTKSNLASARAALMQAWRSFRREQEDLVEDVVRPMVEAALDEDLSRGRLVLPTGDDLAAAARGYYARPERLSTDDYREMQAAQAKVALGISKTTVLREHGHEFDQESRQAADDRHLEQDLGLTPPSLMPPDDPPPPLPPGEQAPAPALTPADDQAADDQAPVDDQAQEDAPHAHV